MKKKILACFMAAALVAASVCGCGGSKDSGTTNGGGTAQEVSKTEVRDTLNIGIDGDNGTLAPVHNSKLAGWVLYETLYLYNTETQEYEMNGLAESMEFTDGQHAVIKLHEGITDSAGNPFTASDVLYCLKNALNDTITSMYVPYIDFENSKVIDDLTVEIALTEVNVMQWIQLNEVRMYTQKAMEDSADGMVNTPVGTGPYVLKEYVTGSSIQLERREDYWGEKPGIKNINFLVISEGSQRAIALESGEIDLCVNLGSADYNRFAGNEAYGTMVRNTFKNDILEFNCSEYSIFHDPRVRQAAAYAVDADAFVQNVYGGLSEVCKGATVNGLPGTDPNWNAEYYEYNVDKAKALLAEAGIAEGTTIKLAVEGKQAAKAEVIQAFLNSVGFDVQINSYDAGSWMSVRTDANSGVDISVHQYSSPDGYYAGEIWSGVFNAGTNHYENEELLKMTEQSLATIDHDEQLKINKQINDIMVEEVPGYGIAAKTSLHAWNAQLKGVEEMMRKKEKIIPSMLSFE